MQPAHYSSLLPEPFRHKTTQVRVFKPQVILLDFHGTMSERRWEDKVIYPYVKQAIAGYLRENWANETVQRCVPGLRNDSFEQRFRHKYDDAPNIDERTQNEDLDQTQLADQVSEYVGWQMAMRRETKETQIIERLVWLEGFRRKQIATPIYDDVMSCVKLWREQYNCAIYVTSSVDSDTLKVLFENTDKGNLSQHLSGYVSAKKTGDKMISDMYRQFYEKLNLRPHKEQRIGKLAKSVPATTCLATATGSGAKSPPNCSSSQSLRSQSPNSPISSQLSETSAKPILFLTDSGQEAKAASRVADGTAFECLLVNRPGNKRIRTYYLSQFQFIEKFDDIEFV